MLLQICPESIQLSPPLNSARYAIGTTVIILRHNNAIHTILNLALCSRIIGDNYRLAKYLSFANRYTLSLIATWLNIDVTCLDIGIRIILFAKQNHMTLHACFSNLLTNQWFITTKSDDVPSQIFKTYLKQSLHYVGHVIIILCMAITSNRQQIDAMFWHLIRDVK